MEYDPTERDGALPAHPAPELLRQYEEGHLDAAQVSGLEAHLAGCDACAAQLTRTSPRGHPAPAAPDRPAGSTVGRYRVRGRLGQGGMGVVYRAYDPKLSRDVALKVLRPEAGQAREALLAEARALARLAHPNVVAVHDVVDEGGEVALAMELVEGDTLAARRAAPLRERLRWLHEAAKGLQAIHAAGLVHRDFKPSNVLVGADGRARVADFGLAHLRALAPEQPIAGTPAYMPPEQRTGQGGSQASDVFSFCVSAAEVLAGSDVEGAGRLGRLLKAGRSALPSERPTMEQLAAALAERLDRSRQRLALVAGLAVIALTVVAVASSRGGPNPCDELTAFAHRAWEPGQLPALAAQGVPAALLDVLRARGATLESAIGAACHAPRPPTLDRISCLSAAAEDLHLAAAVARDVPPELRPLTPRLLLRVADAARCEGGVRRAPVLREEDWPRATEVLKEAFLANAARIDGQYPEAEAHAAQAVATAKEVGADRLQAVGLIALAEVAFAREKKAGAQGRKWADQAEVAATAAGAVREVAHAAVLRAQLSCQDSQVECRSLQERAGHLAAPLGNSWLDAWTAEFEAEGADALGAVRARWAAIPGGDYEAQLVLFRQMEALYREGRLEEEAALAEAELATPSLQRESRPRLVTIAELVDALTSLERFDEAKVWIERSRPMKAIEPRLVDGEELALALGEGRAEDALKLLGTRQDVGAQISRFYALRALHRWKEFDALEGVLDALWLNHVISEDDHRWYQTILLDAALERGDAAKARALAEVWPEDPVDHDDVEIDVRTLEGREAEARALMRSLAVPDGGSPGAEVTVHCRRAELALREGRFADAEAEARAGQALAHTVHQRFLSARLLGDALLSEGKIAEGCKVGGVVQPALSVAIPPEVARNQRLRKKCR